MRFIILKLNNFIQSTKFIRKEQRSNFIMWNFFCLKVPFSIYRKISTSLKLMFIKIKLITSQIQNWPIKLPQFFQTRIKLIELAKNQTKKLFSPKTHNTKLSRQKISQIIGNISLFYHSPRLWSITIAIDQKQFFNLSMTTPYPPWKKEIPQKKGRLLKTLNPPQRACAVLPPPCTPQRRQ